MPGVLAMVRKIAFTRDVTRHEPVVLRVQPLRWYGKLRSFAAQAFVPGEPDTPICSGDIIVAEVPSTTVIEEHS